MARKFWQVLDLQKDKKTPKKCPFCLFLASQEVVLGDCIFEGQMESKSKNSSCSRKETHQDFQWAIL